MLLGNSPFISFKAVRARPVAPVTEIISKISVIIVRLKFRIRFLIQMRRYRRINERIPSKVRNFEI